MTPSRREGLISVDIARACAALAVFLYHYGVGPTLAKFTGWASLALISWPGAVVAVPLFFVLSGYCIHASELRRSRALGSDARAFARRRFWRLYPAYLFALALSVGVNLAQGRPDAPLDVAVHALLLQAFSEATFNSINPVLWTLSVECALYALYPAWARFRARHGLAAGVALAAAVSAASLAAFAALAFPFQDWERLFFLNLWIGWIAGAWLYEALERPPAWLRSRAWWIAGILVWLALPFVRDGLAGAGRWQILEAPLLVLACVWPLCALLVAEARLRRLGGLAGRGVGLLAGLGLASYSLYLLHEPLIDLRNLLTGGLDAGAARLAVQAGWFFVVLYACHLSYRFVERPGIRFGVPRAA